MAIQLMMSPDLQALVEKRLATGAYQNAEDVVRCALEAQDDKAATRDIFASQNDAQMLDSSAHRVCLSSSHDPCVTAFSVIPVSPSRVQRHGI